MKGARDDIIAVLSELPSDASLDVVRYEFETIFAILEGAKDAEEGRTHSLEEVREMARQCLSKYASRRAPAGT
jgi:pyruvate/oxaloacetate carboxyltransferase